MAGFQGFLEEMGWSSCNECDKYCQIGSTYCIHNDDMDGLYWFYETDQFIIDIHDFFIKKERITNSFPDLSPYMSFCSSYIKTANGECFNPYRSLTANTMFVTNIDRNDFRFLLHGNFPYFSVGINFKEKMIRDCLLDSPLSSSLNMSDVFFETQEIVTRPLEKLANAILSCKMDSPAGEIFLEAKAKEWFSITLNAYLNKSTAKSIPLSDEKSIESVVSYINDHYALDITQDLLEQIAVMSGTKLKNVFKQKYQMSITEYIQRKRINIAETLLATTELEIKDIAKSVGYHSHSRFSALFKKYKGIYPREVKKLNEQNFHSTHRCPMKRP